MSSILIRKAGGFYHVFDDDAIIISYLMDYKITDGRCGFPINSIDKVINVLEDNKISYEIKDGNKKSYKKYNKYNYFLEKGKKKIDIDYRINSIVDKLNDFSYDKLCKILDMIEDYVNEG